MCIHVLSNKCLDQMQVKFEQIVWSKLHQIVNFLNKMVNLFWQSVDAIL